MKKLKREQMLTEGGGPQHFYYCIVQLFTETGGTGPNPLDIVPAKSLPENYGGIDKVGQRADIHMTHGRIALVYMWTDVITDLQLLIQTESCHLKHILSN